MWRPSSKPRPRRSTYVWQVAGPSIPAVQRFFQPPAAVGPEPIRGALEHVDFAGAGVALGHGVGLRRLASVPERLQIGLVISAANSAHAHIQHRQGGRPRNLIGADGEGGVLSREPRPKTLGG